MHNDEQNFNKFLKVSMTFVSQEVKQTQTQQKVFPQAQCRQLKIKENICVVN